MAGLLRSLATLIVGPLWSLLMLVGGLLSLWRLSLFARSARWRERRRIELMSRTLALATLDSTTRELVQEELAASMLSRILGLPGHAALRDAVLRLYKRSAGAIELRDLGAASRYFVLSGDHISVVIPPLARFEQVLDLFLSVWLGLIGSYLLALVLTGMGRDIIEALPWFVLSLLLLCGAFALHAQTRPVSAALRIARELEHNETRKL